MKHLTTKVIFLILSLALINCGKSSHDEHHDHDASEEVEDDAGKALLDEVDKIHDEAMEKMGEVRKLRNELKKTIENSSDLVEEKKKEIEPQIAKLDSAYNGMMDWMHKFHPEVDTLDEEAYREYLEEQLEKAKKVKSDILEAIERAREN
jgi:vacuolar-type H+-ATPase subunit I/STV1